MLCVPGAWPGVFRESGCVATKLSLPPQNIQSTNWQSMRFKPPPPNSSIGWRVEFRPLEVSEIVSQVPDKVRAKPYLVTIIGFYLQIQLTDFENAALVVFVVLLTRAILSFKLNLYIPMSKVSPRDDTISKVKGQYDIKAWSKATHMKHTSDIWISASCAK